MIKKISELTESSAINESDMIPFVDSANELTKKAQFKDLLNAIVPKNAGAHNSVYRGRNITDLFTSGELSARVAAETFDDIFVGDYIIGSVSNRKYIVADINYRKGCGDTECTTPHILMIPEKCMGSEKMNDSNVTTGAYTGSAMYTTNLAAYKTIIQNDFGANHILQHRTYLPNAVTNGYESAGAWVDSTVELMNELMVYGSNIFHNTMSGTNVPTGNITIDKTQLSLFRLDKTKIQALDDSNARKSYWLRDVVSASSFAFVSYNGNPGSHFASYSLGVRPAFLIY